MKSKLRDGIHVCAIGEKFVVLDVDSERYYLLRDTGAEILRRYFGDVASEEDCVWMAAKRLISREPYVSESATFEPNPALTSLLEQDLPRAGLRFTAEAACTLLMAKRKVRSKPLKVILASLGADRPPPSGSERHLDAPQRDDKLARIVAAFERSRRYIASTDECLPRSIAMTSALRRHGFRASLIIGVSLPFVAHSWVQIGNSVASDRLDRVLPYTPILTL